jgi:hypothetical protein
LRTLKFSSQSVYIYLRREVWWLSMSLVYTGGELEWRGRRQSTRTLSLCSPFPTRFPCGNNRPGCAACGWGELRLKGKANESEIRPPLLFFPFSSFLLPSRLPCCLWFSPGIPSGDFRRRGRKRWGEGRLGPGSPPSSLSRCRWRSREVPRSCFRCSSVRHLVSLEDG